jgi:acyl-coenzyme A synthetase/AMP-(fatty) acid ligase
MMNALGYRVAPEEVEAALIAHPDIQAAAAVEVRVRSDLSLIAAFIECPGEKPSDKVLHAHASGLLADYKVPKLWRFIDELPRNPNGKLQRRKLREAHDVATE